MSGDVETYQQCCPVSFCVSEGRRSPLGGSQGRNLYLPQRPCLSGRLSICTRQWRVWHHRQEQASINDRNGKHCRRSQNIMNLVHTLCTVLPEKYASWSKHVQPTIPPTARQNAFLVQGPCATNHKFRMLIVDAEQLWPSWGW